MFIAYTNGDEKVLSRLPANPPEDISRFRLNEFQHKALRKFAPKYSAMDNLRFVTCFVKPAFLLGPVCELEKIFSTIEACSRMNRNSDHHFVPLVFIDDDTHDNLESSGAMMFDGEYDTVRLRCDPAVYKDDRRILAAREFGDEIKGIMHQVASLLPENEHKNEIEGLMREIYTSGKGWTKAYIDFLKRLFESEEIEFVRLSVLREKGYYTDFLKIELDNYGKTMGLIDSAAESLSEYEISPRAFRLNLKFIENGITENIIHKENEIYQIGNGEYEMAGIRKLFDKKPRCFAPRVMLMPPCLHSAFPAAAHIAGPSELVYFSLMKEVYELFKCHMPVVIPRHSAAWLDKNAFLKFRKEHKDNFVFNFVFPNGNLQERIISPVYFMGITGIKRFMAKMKELVSLPPDKHYSVKL